MSRSRWLEDELPETQILSLDDDDDLEEWDDEEDDWDEDDWDDEDEEEDDDDWDDD